MTTEDSSASAGEFTTLRSGFEAFYRPTPEELTAVYSKGLVVLDANVLLDLYRLSPAARKSLLDLLRRVRDRLFVPSQVAAEFHRNRAAAVADRREELAQARGQLEEHLRKSKGAVRRLANRAHADAGRGGEVARALEESFALAKKFVDEAIEEFDLDADKLVGQRDAVLTELEHIVDGRVNVRPPDSQVIEDKAEAERRGQSQEPPGFRDGGKGENPHGDYLWWAEVVRHVHANPSAVVIISNDSAKGDWTHSLRGIQIGLDPRLVAEVSEVTRRPVFMRSTGQFLEDGKSLLGISISEQALNEARSLPSGSRPSSRVPFAQVADITNVNPKRISIMQRRGWLPLGQADWSWRAVRKTIVLNAAIRAGVTVPHLQRLSDFLNSPRPVARTVVVLTERACIWLRPTDADEFLAELDEPPVFVFHTAMPERRARIMKNAFEKQLNELPEEG